MTLQYAITIEGPVEPLCEANPLFKFEVTGGAVTSLYKDTMMSGLARSNSLIATDLLRNPIWQEKKTK